MASESTALQSFIRDAWVSSTGVGAALVNPSTEETIATATTHGVDLISALPFARDVGGVALRAMTFAERGALLKKLSSALHTAREQLIDASIQNAGATRSDAKFDIDGGIGTLAHYARLGEELGDRKILVEGAGEPLLRSPRLCGYHIALPRTGVAVHINAFNFPVWGMCEKAACALLAGVPLITKPATSTALVAARAFAVMVEAGFPTGAMQFVAGSVGNLLELLLPEDAIAFTGSADTGAKLRSLRSVIERNVRINIEADSLNAAALLPDVQEGSDLWHLFVRHLSTEIVQKTGQKCTATRRVLVPRDRLAALQAALSERLSAIKIGNPAADGVEMGPLATASQLSDAIAGIHKLTADGARVVLGGAHRIDGIGSDGGKGYFLAPTLLVHDDAKAARAVHQHEVFGPVTTLLPYDAASEVAPLIARGEGCLVSSIYSDDKAAVEDVIVNSATWMGRLLVCTPKIADMAQTPGMVLPASIHGGPGRAGGGEELGGRRGLAFYQQRTAIQGDRTVLDKILGAPKSEASAAV